MAQIWNKVKEKIDKVAEAIALMERGEYEFPDGKQRWTMEEGDQGQTLRVPRVIRSEAMRYAKYSSTSKDVYANIFKDDGKWHSYYRERLNWHRMRLSTGIKKELSELTDDGNALKHLSELSYKVLIAQLEDVNAPKKLKPETVAKIYLDATKLEAQVKGDLNTKHASRVEIGQVNVMGNLPASYTPRGIEAIQDDEEVIEVEDA